MHTTTASLPMLLTPEQAAKQIGVGRTRIYGLISSGELPSVKIGRSRRIQAEALTHYVAGLVEQSAS